MIYQRKGQRHRSSFMCNVFSKLLTVCKNNQLTNSWRMQKKNHNPKLYYVEENNTVNIIKSLHCELRASCE